MIRITIISTCCVGLLASGSGLENVQGTAISYHSILVSWKSPTASFTSKQSFQITYQSRRSNSTVVRTSQHEMVLKGLKPNTNYTITVGSCLTAVDCQRKSTIVVRTKKARKYFLKKPYSFKTKNIGKNSFITIGINLRLLFSVNLPLLTSSRY